MGILNVQNKVLLLYFFFNKSQAFIAPGKKSTRRTYPVRVSLDYIQLFIFPCAFYDVVLQNLLHSFHGVILQATGFLNIYWQSPGALPDRLVRHIISLAFLYQQMDQQRYTSRW